MSADESRVIEQLDRGFDTYLEDIRAAMRQPSVSRTGEGIAAMADWVEAYLRRLGASTWRAPGRIAPIVEGVLGDDPAAPTLLFYDLYDVQPAAGQPGWTVPPFDAAIVADGDGGRRLVGRGPFNSKGPLVGFLAVLRAFRDAGVAIPINLRFLIEGEEEIGSPSLAPHLRAHRDRLKQCDAVFIPYFATNSRGDTMIRLGFKGIMHLVFSVEGGAWGGPQRQDIHAWHCGWVASPSWELVRALASLQTEDGGLAIDGLAVPPPDADDLALIDALAASFDADTWQHELGIARFKRDADPRALLADLMLGPTLNIDALAAGQIDEGADPATLIPRRAVAYADLRLVPGMSVDGTLALLRAHLDRRGFAHVAVAMKTGYPASRTSPHAPAVAALLAACRRMASASRCSRSMPAPRRCTSSRTSSACPSRSAASAMAWARMPRTSTSLSKACARTSDLWPVSSLSSPGVRGGHDRLRAATPGVGGCGAARRGHDRLFPAAAVG